MSDEKTVEEEGGAVAEATTSTDTGSQPEDAAIAVDASRSMESDPATDSAPIDLAEFGKVEPESEVEEMPAGVPTGEAILDTDLVAIKAQDLIDCINSVEVVGDNNKNHLATAVAQVKESLKWVNMATANRAENNRTPEE